jgi:ribonuclease-3
MNDKQITTLQDRLNYTFNDLSLLITALTHSSYANENKSNGYISNERLEFLGDSILGLTVAELIYTKKTQMPEGQMTKLRAELVCERSLASLAKTLGIGEYMLFGRGEDKGGGRQRPSILADAVEAIIAAMYIDGGLQPVNDLIEKHLFLDFREEFEFTDYKTALQELIHTKPGKHLTYNLITLPVTASPKRTFPRKEAVFLKASFSVKAPLSAKTFLLINEDDQTRSLNRKPMVSLSFLCSR